MTGPALVIKATFAEWRMVKTRKVLQLVMEVPLEQQGDVLTRLGTPMPDQEKWVAIALLDPKAQLKDMLERSVEHEDENRCDCGATLIFDDVNGIARCPRCKSYESYIPPQQKAKDLSRSLAGKERYSNLPADAKIVVKAAMLTKDPAFQEWAGCIGSPEDADSYIKRHCFISSKTELAHKVDAQELFYSMLTDFEIDTNRIAESRG